jgi:GTP-binding protein EngB required for normal cell division
MNEIVKKRLLKDCNNTPLENFVEPIRNGNITWIELLNHNFLEENILKLEALLNSESLIEKPSVSIFDDEPNIPHTGYSLDEQKEKKVDNNNNNDLSFLSADEIRTKFQQGDITLEDLNIPNFSQKRIDALKIYIKRNQSSPPMYNLSDLDELRKDSTDIYFVGLSRTGKSSILSSILLTSIKNGNIYNDVKNNPKGVAMQNLYTEDLDLGIIPDPTTENSFNYLPANISNNGVSPRPLNFIEMPGELWKSLKENPNEKDELLRYLKNDNKKIIIFVLDVTYRMKSEPPQTKMQQINAYNQFLSMFDEMDVLKQTYAIYFVLNKIDIVGDNSFDLKTDTSNAYKIFKEDFIILENTAKRYKSRIADKIELKLFPFSLGKVVNNSIVEDYKTEYANLLINELLKDGHYIKESFFSRFF